MGPFIYMSVAALICYGFLFLIFAAARKNRIINAFLLLLASFIAWTGGSLCMRMMLWPSYELWYNVSLCGIMFSCFAYPKFICALSGEEHKTVGRVLLIATLACCIINMPSGLLVKAPEVVETAGGQIQFVYAMDWKAVIVFIVAGVSLSFMLYVLIKNCLKDRHFAKQVQPIIVGIILLFLGNAAISLPFLKGFPVDILSAVLNALLVFYALIKRRLFKMKLLASEGMCYGVALVLAVGIFYYLSPAANDFLASAFPSLSEYYGMLYAVLFFIVILSVSFLLKNILNTAFVKEEIIQAENLKQFSAAISKSLNLQDIFGEIVHVIKSTTDIKSVYICIQPKDGEDYEIVYSDNPLKDRSIRLKADNPMVRWLEKNDECLQIKTFRHTIEYRSMWEEEKRQLLQLHVECLIGLKENQKLVGIIMLSSDNKKKAIGYNDINFMLSVSSIASIAVKNSRLYEAAITEARTDELTGLLNRKSFYEIIQTEFEKCKNSSLVLVIINIDDFKLYNQLYGNKEGDRALQSVAAIIKASVGDNGYVARYSGKEFALILPHFDILAAKSLTKSISEQINGMNKNSGEYSLKVLTVSAGISAVPFGASSVRELIDNADMAVYFIKHNGKNGIKVFDVVEHGKQNQNGAESHEHIYMAYESTIYALTAAIDAKDHYTFSHSNNVAYYATALAKAAGMGDDFVEIVRQAGLLHDIGKISIPENILNKPGKLTDEEYEMIKGHVEASVAIIRHLPSLDYVVPAVIGHHERYDGRGYPRRISGRDIPLAARILCIADSFDAMISRRSYKNPMALETVLMILKKEAGHQFDPELTPVFIREIRSGHINVVYDDGKDYILTEETGK